MKENNFDFLRLCAATAVIWSHVPPLLGVPGNRGDFGAAGVSAFFAASGYLVTGSWDRDPHAVRFAIRRILRIAPGLTVVVLLSALVLGPLLTTVTVKQYFGSSMVPAYCRDIFLFPMSYGLPYVFQGNPEKLVVNGSLWTLPIEVVMYFSVLVIGGLRIWKLPMIASLLCGASALAVFAHYNLWTLPPAQIPTILTLNSAELIDCSVCFLTGATLAKTDRIPKLSWIWLPVVALCGLLHPHPIESLILVFAIPYAAISFALTPLPFIKRSGRFGDFSYGMYIYAFPIMQTIVMLYPRIGQAAFVAVSVSLAVVAGALSWWLVESRALKAKSLIQPDKATPHGLDVVGHHLG